MTSPINNLELLGDVRAKLNEVIGKLNGNLPVTLNIDGGSVDGTTIGGNVPAAGSFSSLTVNGVVVSNTDLSKLAGVTATAAELNVLDGATVTTAELNILDGVTVTTAELNILDGVTATAAELNVLGGITGIASKSEAEAGAATDKLMNALRTRESAQKAIADGGLTLTGGYLATNASDGSFSAGTYTPAPATSNFRSISNAGAFTIAAPTAPGQYALVIEVTNATGAGVITLSGFSRSTGDAFTTTVGHRFQVYIVKTLSGSTVNVMAMQ